MFADLIIKTDPLTEPNRKIFYLGLFVIDKVQNIWKSFDSFIILIWPYASKMILQKLNDNGYEFFSISTISSWSLNNWLRFSSIWTLFYKKKKKKKNRSKREEIAFKDFLASKPLDFYL